MELKKYEQGLGAQVFSAGACYSLLSNVHHAIAKKAKAKAPAKKMVVVPSPTPSSYHCC